MVERVAVTVAPNASYPRRGTNLFGNDRVRVVAVRMASVLTPDAERRHHFRVERL